MALFYLLCMFLTFCLLFMICMFVYFFFYFMRLLKYLQMTLQNYLTEFFHVSYCTVLWVSSDLSALPICVLLKLTADMETCATNTDTVSFWYFEVKVHPKLLISQSKFSIYFEISVVADKRS